MLFRRLLAKFRNTLVPYLPELRTIEVPIAQLDYLFNHGTLPLGPPYRSYTRYLAYLRTSGALYDPLRQFVTDKEHAKLYVAAKVGPRYNVPTHLTTSSLEQACTFQHHEDVIVKPTHMSGEVKLLKPGETLSHDLARKWLSTNYYRLCREGNYRYLKRKIVFEPCLSDGGSNPTEFKFHCFWGSPKFVSVQHNGLGARTGRFYQCDWTPLNLKGVLPRAPIAEKPGQLEEMCWVAEQLSAPFATLRVDLYLCGGSVYVGELTNCHTAAKTHFTPAAADEIIGGFLRDPSLSASEAFEALK